MDERRLTAWLITQGLLKPEQVKAVLEEQLRLGQSGQKLDIIAVARRRDLLTDEQVVSLIERTGYQPQAAAGPIAALASQEVSAIGSAISDASAIAPAVGADESAATPVDVSALAKPTASPQRSRRRSSGSRLATSGTHSRRRRSGANPALLAGAFMVPVVLAIAFVASSGGSDDDLATHDDEVAVRPVAPGRTSLAPLLDDLRESLDKLERANDGDKAGRKVELKRLVGIVRRLRAADLKVTQLQVVDRCSERLETLRDTEGGAKAKRDAENELVIARAEQAWRRTSRNFEKILWLCLQQRRSPLQRGAEAVRGVNQREDLAKRIRHYASKGPDGIAKLVASEDLHPILGIGGYEALIKETERFPDDLRDTDLWSRWRKILPQFEELRRRATDYARALRFAERASARGDLAGARGAFLKGQFATTDRWWAAIREFLDLPEVVAAFAARTREIEAGRVPSSRGIPGLPDTAGTRVSVDATTWRDRFLGLEREYRKAKKDATARAAAVKGLVDLLAETQRLAQRSFETCQEIVRFYDRRPKVFRAERDLKTPLKAHHALYFEEAFKRATGPGTLRRLDRWCAEHGYEAWRARLKPYLRLVAGATGKAGRAREGKRKGREAAKAAVGEFASKRLKMVAEGFGAVLEWMRQRGYAPQPAVRELDAMISRGVERAGDPVAGSRLRAELGDITDKPDDPNRSRHEKGFRKQVDAVIREVVSSSLKAVTKCVNAGEPGLAFDLFQYVLLLDPDNDRAHKGLGHVKVGDQWLRQFEASRLKAGYTWSSKYAWMQVAQRARYEGGEVYDLGTKGWRKLPSANGAHADANDPWVIKTEHFELRSTAPLGRSARVAERLEAFYLAMFRQYDLFFMAKGGARLIFGMSASQSKPLVVNFYRDRPQFQRHSNPPTDWAAGFYSGGKHASFFYDSRDWTTLQHEIVHQILGETSPGYAESWLAEGAAVYLENSFFRDGVMTLGSKRSHRRITAYESNQRSGGQEHRLRTVLGFKTGAQWDSGDISKNYRGAGAVIYFLCTFDGGRYRSDFVEFLRDAYYGRTPSPADYFGMPLDVLDALMQHFYVPDAKLSLPGGGELASQADLEAARDALVASCGKKTPDIDQLSESYTMVRKALAGATGKDADKARSRSAKAVVGLRRKLIGRVEKAIKRSVDKRGLEQRFAKLARLREAALAVILDKSIYPDENHGAVGQPIVDEKVNALAAHWSQVPDVFSRAEVKADLELIEVTEPWLDEFEVHAKKRGKTVADLQRDLRSRAGLAGAVLTTQDQERERKEQKVRDWNASQTQVPDTTRDQVRALNDYREMLGLHLLAIEQRLYQAAQKHSEWMQRSGNMSHNQPNPATATPTNRARQEGYTDPVSENVAFGYHTATSVHKGWYTSSGHHRNMIGARIYEVGVGKSGTYWCQLFGMGKPKLN